MTWEAGFAGVAVMISILVLLLQQREKRDSKLALDVTFRARDEANAQALIDLRRDFRALEQTDAPGRLRRAEQDIEWLRRWQDETKSLSSEIQALVACVDRLQAWQESEGVAYIRGLDGLKPRVDEHERRIERLDRKVFNGHRPRLENG